MSGKMKLVVLVAILLVAGVAFATQTYSWDGITVRPLNDPSSLRCDHWAMWYFKEGAPQFPRSQWGSASGATPESVVQQWEEAKTVEKAWQDEWTKYGMTWKKSAMTYNNALGPICVVKVIGDPNDGWADKPEALEKLEFMGHAAKEISEVIKTLRETVNEDKMTPYEKSQFEEYLDKLSDIPEKMAELHHKIIRASAPDMAFISQTLNTFYKNLNAARASQPVLAKKFPVPSKVTPPPQEAQTPAFEVREEPAMEPPPTCEFPKLVGTTKGSGHMDSRGESHGWFQNQEMVCESGVHYRVHCGDDVSAPTHCITTGKPAR